MADVMRTVKIPRDLYEWADQLAKEQAEQMHRRANINSVLLQLMFRGKEEVEKDRH